ncbi:MAG TPA: hypothetical protein PK263_03415, partial [bacterium]|nr:hypothetical protein [bacterium]
MSYKNRFIAVATIVLLITVGFAVARQRFSADKFFNPVSPGIPSATLAVNFSTSDADYLSTDDRQSQSEKGGYDWSGSNHMLPGSQNELNMPNLPRLSVPDKDFYYYDSDGKAHYLVSYPGTWPEQTPDSLKSLALENENKWLYDLNGSANGLSQTIQLLDVNLDSGTKKIIEYTFNQALGAPTNFTSRKDSKGKVHIFFRTETVSGKSRIVRYNATNGELQLYEPMPATQSESCTSGVFGLSASSNGNIYINQSQKYYGSEVRWILPDNSLSSDSITFFGTGQNNEWSQHKCSQFSNAGANLDYVFIVATQEGKDFLAITPNLPDRLFIDSARERYSNETPWRDTLANDSSRQSEFEEFVQRESIYNRNKYNGVISDFPESVGRTLGTFITERKDSAGASQWYVVRKYLNNTAEGFDYYKIVFPSGANKQKEVKLEKLTTKIPGDLVVASPSTADYSVDKSLLTAQSTQDTDMTGKVALSWKAGSAQKTLKDIDIKLNSTTVKQFYPYSGNFGNIHNTREMVGFTSDNGTIFRYNTETNSSIIAGTTNINLRDGILASNGKWYFVGDSVLLEYDPSKPWTVSPTVDLIDHIGDSKLTDDFSGRQIDLNPVALNLGQPRDNSRNFYRITEANDGILYIGADLGGKAALIWCDPATRDSGAIAFEGAASFSDLATTNMGSYIVVATTAGQGQFFTMQSSNRSVIKNITLRDSSERRDNSKSDKPTSNAKSIINKIVETEPGKIIAITTDNDPWHDKDVDVVRKKSSSFAHRINIVDAFNSSSNQRAYVEKSMELDSKMIAKFNPDSVDTNGTRVYPGAANIPYWNTKLTAFQGVGVTHHDARLVLGPDQSVWFPATEYAVGRCSQQTCADLSFRSVFRLNPKSDLIGSSLLRVMSEQDKNEDIHDPAKTPLYSGNVLYFNNDLYLYSPSPYGNSIADKLKINLRKVIPPTQNGRLFNEFTIRTIQDKNGDIVVSGAESYLYGVVVPSTGTANLTITFKPKDGYSLKEALLDGRGIGTSKEGDYVYKLTNIDSNHVISARFEDDQSTLHTAKVNNYRAFEIDAQASISLSSDGTAVSDGSSLSFSVTPPAGQEVASMTVNGTDFEPVTVSADNKSAEFTTPPLKSNTGIAINLEKATPAENNQIGVEYSEEGGRLVYDSGQSTQSGGSVSVSYGSNATFTAEAKSGYHIAHLFVDSYDFGAAPRHTFSKVVRNHSIKAIFEENDESVATHTITINKSGEGTISLPEKTTVYAGSNLGMSIIPNGNWYTKRIKIDGRISDISNILFLNGIDSSHTVDVEFAQWDIPSAVTQAGRAGSDPIRITHVLEYRDSGSDVAYVQSLL